MPPPDSTKHAPMINDQVYDASRLGKFIPGLHRKQQQPNGFIKALGKDDDGQLIVIAKFYDDQFTMRYGIVEYNYNEHFKGRWNGKRWHIGEEFDTEAEKFSDTEAEIDALCGMKPLTE